MTLLLLLRGTTGTTTTHGSATGSTVRAGTAAGHESPSGSASGSTVRAGSASGHESPSGSATGSTARTGSASGSRTSSGSATGSTARTGTASGSKTSRGSASGSTARTGTAAGSRTASGSATGTTTRAGSASGSRTASGSSTGTTVRVGSATGSRIATGTGSGATAWTGTASGSTSTSGAATGATARVGTASGSFTARGGSTGSTVRTSTASGSIIHDGSATGASAWIGTASGPTSLPAITQVAALSGTATGTSATIALPTYLTTDYVVLWVSSNNANAQTLSANVTGTLLASAGNRLNAWRIVPQDGAQTTFTLSVAASSVLTWWIVTYRGVDPAYVVGAGNNIGNSTTSAIEGTAATASWVATGNELVLSAGSVNSTATWTTTASTKFNTTAGNGALMVNGGALAAGALTATPTAMDRGLAGTSRNESAATLILSPAGDTRQVNRLTNPSFEDAAAMSAGWENEKTVLGTPAYTKVTTPLADGARAQQMQYAGQAGDSGLFAVYQSPIAATPGEVLTFKISLAGSKANCTLIIGIEGFGSGQVYISEADTVVSALTGTMTEYSVTYTVPANAVAVACYVQANEIAPTTSATIQMDKASLTSVPSVVKSGTATGTTGWVGAASGHITTRATATGTVAYTGTASGSRGSAGSGTGATLYVGTAAGHAPSIAGTAGTATGSTVRTGTASGSHRSAGTASGVTVHVGTAHAASSPVTATPTPATRILVVAAESRLVLVEPDLRLFTVAAESRVDRVPAESRIAQATLA